MKRKLWIILVSVGSVVILLTACLAGLDRLFDHDDSVSVDEAAFYVNNHVELLERFPYEDYEAIVQSEMSDLDAKEQQEQDFIRHYLGNKTIVKSVYAFNQDIVEFYCGGSGMLDVGTYTGFYYSRQDTPFAFEFGEVELTQTGPDIFEWYDAKGETGEHKGHRLYTEKIRDNWWYYTLIWY